MNEKEEEKEEKKDSNSNSSNSNRVNLGLFFIMLGCFILVATNDLLRLGAPSEYFSWTALLIFIGLTLMIGRSFLVGFLFIAGGGWFMLDDLFFIVPEYVENMYWPAVLIITGIGVIVASLIKKRV